MAPRHPRSVPGTPGGRTDNRVRPRVAVRYVREKERLEFKGRAEGPLEGALPHELSNRCAPRA